MADPSGGVYFEAIAPDWRFAAFFLLMAVALTVGHARTHMSHAQRTGSVGVVLMLYAWTLASGNGRYFLSGLLMVGPLVVMACSLLPGTKALRASALGLVLVLQGVAVQLFFNPDLWGLAQWNEKRPVLEPSPLREQPAVFLTLSGVSYSILVPRFHPQSRWSNIAGQHLIGPGVPEYKRLQGLLASPLPKYLVVPTPYSLRSLQQQPEPERLKLMRATLGLFGLALQDLPCTLLQSQLNPGPPDIAGQPLALRGFWVCAVEPGPVTHSGEDAQLALSTRMADVFERIEQRCPRFFPPGDGKTSRYDGVTLRLYTGSDVKVYIGDNNQVFYRHFRAMNPTLIGTVADIRQGKFTLECEKLPGRYRLPWQRD